ncbi:mycofactocin-coupled SDR family oxidoreductase [Rhodococcus erythropolis]|uniref:mycofactocin-coupled SDR family oxidoreductase n=1 Tax=Rhodococcus erythropolis TaxID=1833 RepID=UPI002226CB1D|nr:mycofactocin-coupled SDR family oxidoreductase [Rhodococcus erythropolis]MCW2295364.1 SDR family mycofactocin-dependent oxidoreductase [Rhodococcus erythropolis]
MNRVEGKVALITGAARGQGRNHALRLAEQGADIILTDACIEYDSMPYRQGTEEDLAITAKMVEEIGRKVFVRKADVRDHDQMSAAVNDGVAELGHLDIVCANAGICSCQPWDEVTPQLWKDTLDVVLTGVWNTCVASIPHLINNGGGSIIITGSTSAVKGQPLFAPYVAAKHGVLGILRSLANELAPHHIRVNAVHPAGVDTPMQESFGGIERLFANNPHTSGIYMNAMPDVDLVKVEDVTNAVLYLADDGSRYVTGSEMRVDAGCLVR